MGNIGPDPRALCSDRAVRIEMRGGTDVDTADDSESTPFMRARSVYFEVIGRPSSQE